MWKSIMVFIPLFLGDTLRPFAESACELQNRRYENGETFTPVLGRGISSCVNCTCVENEIQCTKLECPTPKCREPTVTPEVCCPFCTDFANLPPTVDTDEGPVTENSGRQCVQDGRNYSDGEVFTTNRTGIQRTSDNQCVNCVCTRGTVLCHLKTCDIPSTCQKFINSSDSCCKKCADNLNPSLDTVIGTENDCTDTQGVSHRNGSEWRPAVSNCITCSCMNGNIDCHKIRCPSDKSLKCRNPRRRGQECCKTCRKKRKVCLNTIRRRNNRSSRKGGKGRRRNRNRNRRPPRPDAALPSLRENQNIDNLTIPDFYEDICMPKRSSYIVYTLTEGHYLFIAFEDVKSYQVEVWRWRLKRRACGQNSQSGCASNAANIRMTRPIEKYTYPGEVFRKQTSRAMATSTTNNKQLRKFKRRLTKSLAKCSRRERCKVKAVTRKLNKAFKRSQIGFNCGCRK